MYESFLNMVRNSLTEGLSELQIEFVIGKLASLCPEWVTDTENSKHDSAQLVESFLSAKHLEGCSEKTLNYYGSTIKPMVTKLGKNIHEITTEDLRNYLSEYQISRNSSKITIDNIRRIFSSFFSWLEDEGYILKSPVRRIHKVKFGRTVKNTFSDEEQEIMRDKCRNIRDLAIVDFLSSTGVRAGELVGLNRTDIDFNERECVVFGKGDSERQVYFDARAKLHLLKYLEERKDDNPALFVSLSHPHERLSINGLESMLKTLELRSGVKNIHPHKFRRTMATRAIDKGMPIEQVQKLLGHIRIDTTLHYAMVNQGNVKNSHRKFIA